MTLHSFQHIAILQTAFLGDVALALFLAQEIRSLHPKVRISFVCTPQAAELVATAVAVDDVVVFDKRRSDKGVQGMLRRARQLRRLHVDAIFALQRSARTAILTRMARPKYSVGFRQASLSGLYSQRVNWDLSQHEVQRNRQLLSCFDDTAQSSLPNSVELRLVGMDELASQLSRDLSDLPSSIVVAPASVWATKRWPAENMKQLVQDLRRRGRPVYVIGAESDRELCEFVAADSGAVSLAGHLSLPQSMSLLQAAAALVCNDSAPTHLAALTGTPTVVVYGSTLPEFGFAPRGEKDQIVEIKNLACRPCGLHGKKQCPRQTLECMTRIQPSMVMAALDRALS